MNKWEKSHKNAYKTSTASLILIYWVRERMPVSRYATNIEHFFSFVKGGF
jgi:hypothetical protein